MTTQDKRNRELIEETGKVIEKFGLTPMQGRIMACFILSDPPEKTFEELVKYFRASKSSVSNSLNFLLQNKFIDYKTFSTDRKRYFYITDSFFRIYFEHVIENVKELKTYAFRTVSMRTPEYPDVNEKILTWIENANLFQESLEKVMSDLNIETVE
jgi:DNA-binding transcriptional regulator GbsR (MarR family)